MNDKRNLSKERVNSRSDRINGFCYQPVLTINNVFPIDLQVVVSIRPALFVPKADRVSELMSHHVLVFAATANGEPCLTTAHFTNLTPTAVE